MPSGRGLSPFKSVALSRCAIMHQCKRRWKSAIYRLSREYEFLILLLEMKTIFTKTDNDMERIRILVAEDHDVFRKGIRSLIEKVPDMEIAGEAVDGQDAVRKARELEPDIVIMDVIMPGMNGIEATRIIRNAGIKTKILTLSLHSDREYIAGMLKAGSSGYLLKDSAFQELIEAVRTVQGNRIFIGQSLLKAISKELSELLEREQKTHILTTSERDVLYLLAAGEQVGGIASRLSAQPERIEKLRDHIIDKWLNLFQ
jgi:two-component system, NarL family, response regulator NreC